MSSGLAHHVGRLARRSKDLGEQSVAEYQRRVAALRAAVSSR
jgi:hypothetical protein